MASEVVYCGLASAGANVPNNIHDGGEFFIYTDLAMSPNGDYLCAAFGGSIILIKCFNITSSMYTYLHSLLQ